MLQGQKGDLTIAFEPAGAFDGRLTISCSLCPKPTKVRLSNLPANEPLFGTCGAQGLDAEDFRRSLRDDVLKQAKNAFKGILE